MTTFNPIVTKLKELESQKKRNTIKESDIALNPYFFEQESFDQPPPDMTVYLVLDRLAPIDISTLPEQRRFMRDDGFKYLTTRLATRPSQQELMHT